MPLFRSIIGRSFGLNANESIHAYLYEMVAVRGVVGDEHEVAVMLLLVMWLLMMCSVLVPVMVWSLVLVLLCFVIRYCSKDARTPRYGIRLLRFALIDWIALLKTEDGEQAHEQGRRLMLGGG